jgi:hypothetical protein
MNRKKREKRKNEVEDEQGKSKKSAPRSDLEYLRSGPRTEDELLFIHRIILNRLNQGFLLQYL